MGSAGTGDNRRSADADDWLLHATVALGGDGCIAEARRRAAGFLIRMRAEHGIPVSRSALDVTQLVVSELVTNARKYAPGPILLDVRIVGETVEVAVCDSDPVLPLAKTTDAGRVGQHGLEIVTAVCQSFEAVQEPFGKRLTARLALQGDPAGSAQAAA